MATDSLALVAAPPTTVTRSARPLAATLRVSTSTFSGSASTATTRRSGWSRPSMTVTPPMWAPTSRATPDQGWRPMRYSSSVQQALTVMASVVIGIAAINTGNNLLYIIVAALLAAILVSGIASALVLRSLELDVHLPEHVFAGRPMLACLLVR